MMNGIWLILNVALAAQITPILGPRLPESPAQQQNTQPARALPQWAGSDGGNAEASALLTIIRTQEDWSQLWRSLDRPAPRALNELREMAVFISIGERTTGGFIPRVVTATLRERDLLVIYNDGKPSPDTMVTQAFTKPWVVAIVQKTSLPVVIEHDR